MYNTGNAGFLAAACNPNRIIDTRITLSLPSKKPVMSPENIVSYKISASSVAGKSFAPGGFVATQLELSLNAASTAVANINFKTTAVGSLSVEAGIQVSTAMVYVPMGTFYPEEDGVTVGDDGYVTIKALNIPPILHTQFNSGTLTLPCTVNEALTKISTETGLAISVTAAEFPNLSVQLLKTFELVTTYREALMYIAEALGAYIQVGRDGKIHLKKVFQGLANIGCVLDDNYLFSVDKQESSVKPFQYISIKASEDDLGVTKEVTEVTTECSYSILDNPLTYGHPEDFLAGLVKPTAFTEFYPAKISFHGRPDLDTGDVLKYTYKGVEYILPICSHVFEYNGGFKTTVESIGSDTLSVSSVDSASKSKITALRQNINSLIRDLTQTQSQITEINGEITKVNTILQTVEALQTQISAIEGDLEKVSTLTQTADGLKLEIQRVDKDLKDAQNSINSNQKTILTYFDFQDDGLTIGINSSDIKLKLINNQIQFLKEGTTDPVAYFSEGQLYVSDAHFLRSLVLGNFEFIPRSNGNLSLKRRG